MTRTRKILTAGLAALTLGASVAATATPADAFGRRGWGGGYAYRGGWGHHRGWGPGALAAGAIGGLALGALAAGAYGGGYGGYGCVANQPVYDSWGNFIGYQRVRVACY